MIKNKCTNDGPVFVLLRQGAVKLTDFHSLMILLSHGNPVEGVFEASMHGYMDTYLAQVS